MATEYICTGCARVFSAKSPACCAAVIAYDPSTLPSDLMRQLISQSNAWLSVYSSWRETKEYREAAAEVMADGNYGAASMINTMVGNLIRRSEHPDDR